LQHFKQSAKYYCSISSSVQILLPISTVTRLVVVLLDSNTTWLRGSIYSKHKYTKHRKNVQQFVQ